MSPNLQPALFHITAGRSMTWRYVFVEEKDRPAVKMVWFTQKQLEAASHIYMDFQDNDEYYRQNLRYVGCNEDVSFFENEGKSVKLDDSRYFTVDYTEKIKMSPLEKDARGVAVRQAAQENIRLQNRMSYRISSAINSEPQETRNILKFMLEINSKLDEALDLLKAGNEDDSTIHAQAVGLNEKGFTFHSELDFPDGEYMYMKHRLDFGDSYFPFHAVLKIRPIERADTRQFYHADFVSLHNNVVDNIVKYLFARERDMMRAVRELWA